MADVPLSKSAGILPRLAPDLTWPGTGGRDGYYSIFLNPQGALTTVFSATGKFMFDLIYVSGMTASELVTFKLTVDGEVIWNDTFAVAPTLDLLGSLTGDFMSTAFQCNSSILFEMQTATDTSVGAYYRLRPIK